MSHSPSSGKPGKPSKPDNAPTARSRDYKPGRAPPRNVVLVVGNTKLPLDHLRDASTRPNVPTKPISLCSVPQKVGDACQLLRGQLRRTTGNRMIVQRLRATRGRYRKPTTDRPFADAKCCSNIDFQPAQAVQTQGLKASPLSYSPIKVLILHPPMLTKVALLAQLSVRRVVRVNQKLPQYAGCEACFRRWP